MKVNDILRANNYNYWINKIIDDNDGTIKPEEQINNIRSEYKVDKLTWQQMMTLIISVNATYLPQRSWLA